MTDNLQTNQQNQPNTPFFTGSLGKFEARLREAGMKEESIAFICGRMIRAVSEEIIKDLNSFINKEEADKLEAIKDIDERNGKIDSILKDKKGKSLADYQQELLEKMVKDFEEAGKTA